MFFSINNDGSSSLISGRSLLAMLLFLGAVPKRLSMLTCEEEREAPQRFRKKSRQNTESHVRAHARFLVVSHDLHCINYGVIAIINNFMANRRCRKEGAFMENSYRILIVVVYHPQFGCRHLRFQDSLSRLVMGPLHVDLLYQQHVILHHLSKEAMIRSSIRAVAVGHS